MSTGAAAVLVVAVATVAVVVFAVAFRWAADTDRRLRRQIVTDRIAADRATYRNLPPGVTPGEVLELQARRGISAEDAARLLFTTRARIRFRAVIERDLARRRRRPLGS